MRNSEVDNPSCREMRVRIKGWSFSRLLRLQRRTWQVHIEGQERLDRLYADRKRFLFCFWHGKYVQIFPLLEGYRLCVITNRSERGNVIAEVSRNLGYQSTRIPDQPRRGSLELMKKELIAAQAGGIAVDGPLGPRHRVKSGVIRIASAAGFDLLPISVDSRRKIVFERRWDRMEIPLLFTKVCLVIGETIKIPPGIRSPQLQDLTEDLAETMLKLDRKAENIIRKRGD